MLRRALLAMLLVACAREAERPSAASDTQSAAQGTPSAQPPGANACPATGQWSRCAVIERLERAGLVPRLDSGEATEPPLQNRGVLVRLGRGELEVYVYPDEAARASDEARLDRSKYVEYSATQPPRPVPTLIRSANLIAILHSRSDHQRERVADALTAGPPQPIRP